jgi:hypothetical protein
VRPRQLYTGSGSWRRRCGMRLVRVTRIAWQIGSAGAKEARARSAANGGHCYARFNLNYLLWKELASTIMNNLCSLLSWRWRKNLIPPRGSKI